MNKTARTLPLTLCLDKSTAPSAKLGRCKVSQECLGPTGPSPGLGIGGDNFLEKLIPTWGDEGLVSTVTGGRTGRRSFRKKATMYKGLAARENDLGCTHSLLRLGSSRRGPRQGPDQTFVNHVRVSEL